MKKQGLTLAVLSAAMFLAACEGDDGANGTNGTNGADGSDGFNSLIAFRDIPKGDAVCLGGGLAVDSGLDTNRNDVLDEGEVQATEIVECEATPTIRALHASPDAPAVNIWVNEVPALTGVDYAQGSGFVPVIEQNNVQIEAILPGDNLVVVNEDIALDYSSETTIIAIGNVAGLDTLAITNPSDSRITQGNFRAQVVHASPSAPAVDVYVTELDADLSGSTPVNGTGTPLVFDPAGYNYTDQLEVPEGNYQIRITPAGDPETVVFDSGEVTLPAGADLMIVAVENTGPGGTPVQLVVLDGAAASTMYDTNTPASVVAVHLSPDAPAVDLLADVNGTEENEALPLVRGVEYNQFCDLAGIPAPGDYTISVVANADNSIVAHTLPPLNVMKGDEAIAIVSGFLTEGLTPAITDITLPGNTRSVATESKLRITHGSPSTPEVDLYLVADGTDISGVDPTFASVPFGADTTLLSITPGPYDAYVTLAGSKEAAISLTELNLVGGEVLDVIARDATGEETGPQPVIIDYSTVEACPAPAG